MTDLDKLAALAEPPCAGCAVFHDLGHPDHVPIDGAAPEPTGLDVERLRKAMDVVVPESIPPLYWTNERLAVALAAEYARLTDSGATDGE